MAELAERVGIIAGALLVALLASWALRRRSTQPARGVGTVDLDPGLHFFSSRSCGSCRSARRALTNALGALGFTEHVWEEVPGVFADVGVDAVPAALVVDSKQEGTLYPGSVKRALSSL